MRIIKEYPPNIAEIRKRFKLRYGVVFAYGTVLYNPDGLEIPEDLMVHEQTHSVQQVNFTGDKKYVDGTDGWWWKYLDDPKFRLEQELEAYRAQYQFFRAMHSRPANRDYLKHRAEELSSALYGNLISFAKAKEQISNDKTSGFW